MGRDDDLYPPPHFQVLDEERMAVARDRVAVERLKRKVSSMTAEVTGRAARLVERDKINGYAMMLRTLLGEQR